VAYSFDPATGNFRRDPTTFGQVYLERAAPLGAGRFNVSFAYSYVELDEIEGHDASDLRDPYPIPLEGVLAAVQIPRLGVEAAVHQFLLAATYGVTDDLEASVAVSLAHSDLELHTAVAAAAITEEGELLLFEEALDDENQVTGIGDILLRAKYRFLTGQDLHIAGGLLLRFPSGNKDDLQGIGFFEVAPSLLASTRVFEPATWARLQGHFNAAVGFNTEDVDESDARWGVGLDWGAIEEVTVSLAVLGRHQFARIAPVGAFPFPRCNTDLITCAADPSERDDVAQLFGIEGDRPDYFTLSVGGRGALWRNTLFAFANVAIALNDGFVRTAPIPLVGFEGTF
jgi:hypothetical protein